MIMDHLRPNFSVIGSWKPAPKKEPAWKRETKSAEIEALPVGERREVRFLHPESGREETTYPWCRRRP